MNRIHASCISLHGHGVLLMGESGCGKSDLALRLIDRGAKLVADDQVELTETDAGLVATAPDTIRGLMELRGIGIFALPHDASTPVSLVFQLGRNQDWIERLPEPEPYHCGDMKIPQIRLFAFEPSAAVKVEMCVRALGDGTMTVGALKA